jgi:hypothetical protein
MIPILRTLFVTGRTGHFEVMPANGIQTGTASGAIALQPRLEGMQ